MAAVRTNLIARELRFPQTGKNQKKLQQKLADHDSALDSLAVDGSTNGAVQETFTVNVPDAATADYDITLDHKIEVIDVHVQKRGGAGAASNTITVKSTGNAITAALDLNVADQAQVRSAAINDANSTIAAGGILRVSSVKSGGNAACLVVISALRRA